MGVIQSVRRVASLFAICSLLATASSAAVIVSVDKQPLPINGLDVYDVHITGFVGADDLPGNTISGIEGTFTAIGGTIQFNGSTAVQIRNNSSNALAGQGVSSWVNFESTVANAFTRTGPAAASALKGLWFTTDHDLRLRPIDETVGANDDGFDQTLLAQVFVSPGGGFKFVGQSNGAQPAIGQPLQFGTIAFPAAEPIAVTVSPPSDTPLTPGALISVSNASAPPQGARDSATVSNIHFTSSRGEFRLYNYPLALAPIPFPNGLVDAGKTKTAVVSFEGNNTSLRSFPVTGSVLFSIFSGPNGAGTGAGDYTYPLTAVDILRGDGSLAVPVGGDYSGLASKSSNTSAMLLAGFNANGPDTVVEMKWFEPIHDPRFRGTFLSREVRLDGVDGDIFVLQMTYDTSMLSNKENAFAAAGKLFLMTYDNAAGWVNAIAGNHGVNTGLTNVQGAWNGQMELGTWGVNTSTHTVWAVLNHSGYFVATPEPSAFALALLGSLATVHAASYRALRRARTAKQSASVARNSLRLYSFPAKLQRAAVSGR